MKSTKFFYHISLLLCSIVFCLWSCRDEEDKTPEDSWESKHLISCYTIPDSIEVTFHRQDSYFYLAIDMTGKKIISYGINDTLSPTRELFDSLAKANNDTSWYGTSSHIAEALAYPVKTISIISDTDYTTGCTAGTDWVEFGTVCADSWGSFVSNGYPLHDDHVKYIEKKFKDYSLEERSLWYGGGCSINFPYPNTPQTHNLTVSVTFENGLTLSTTKRIDLYSR